MYSTITLIISLILLSLSSFNVWASSSLIYDGKEEKIALSPYIDVLEDPKKAYKINDVMGALSSNFKKIPNKQLIKTFQILPSGYVFL